MQEKADSTVSKLAEGKSLRRICKMEEALPFDPPLVESAVRLCLVNDTEGFDAQYARTSYGP